MIRTTLPAFPTARVTDVAPQTDWKTGLPVLSANGVTLRELRIEDAASLHAHLSPREVSRFISPPPRNVEDFERFITWTHGERQAGRYACFAIVPAGGTAAVGLIQVRQLLPSWDVAEWGFALGQAFWGTGMFAAAALNVVDFAIETLRVRRLEARSSVLNGRGNGALQKIGAKREAILRKSFLKDGIAHDQMLWAITAEEWDFARRSASRHIH